MKKLNYLMSFLLMLLIVSCEEKTSMVSLEVSSTTLNFTMEGGSQPLEIGSDGDWNISEIPNWVTLSDVSGVGNKTVTVTAKTNDTGVLRQDQILVRTGDTHRIIPIKIIQSASSSTDGYTLNVTDDSERFLSGYAMGNDSIYIESDVQWVLEGPAWIQAAFKGVNVPLDGRTQCSGSGNLLIMGMDNDSADDRTGILTIRSKVGDKKIEIPLTQMGNFNVHPVKLVVLANSIIWSWKVGRMVKYVYWKHFEGAATDNDKTIDAASRYRNCIEITPTMLSSVSNTKANTNYEICGLGVAADNNTCGNVCSAVFTTPTDQNQPLAIPGNATFDEKWHYSISMNEYATGFYTYIVSAANANHADSYFAYQIKRSLEKRNLYVRDGTFNVNSTDDIHVFTWAVDANGNFSTMLSHLVASKSNEVKSWSSVPAEVEETIDLAESQPIQIFMQTQY